MSAVEQYFAFKLMTMKGAFWVLIISCGVYALLWIGVMIGGWLDKPWFNRLIRWFIKKAK